MRDTDANSTATLSGAFERPRVTFSSSPIELSARPSIIFFDKDISIDDFRAEPARGVLKTEKQTVDTSEAKEVNIAQHAQVMNLKYLIFLLSPGLLACASLAYITSRNLTVFTPYTAEKQLELFENPDNFSVSQFAYRDFNQSRQNLKYLSFLHVQIFGVTTLLVYSITQ